MATDATVDIATASRTLGLSVEALRKRLQRGAARGYKANDGTWRVYLDDGEAGSESGNGASPGAGNSPGAGTAPGNASGGAAGLAAEVSALREDVRILKSHLGDLRRALEETVSGYTPGPAVPSLASPALRDGPVLEQPSIPSGELEPAAPDTGIPDRGIAESPDFGDESPWIDADTSGWDLDEAGDGAAAEIGAEDGDDPFSPAQDPAPHPIAEPFPVAATAGLEEAEIRRMIDDKVDEKLKPALEVLREALLAMQKSR